MSTHPAASTPRSILRYAGLVAVLAALVLGGILGVYYISDTTPKWVYWAVGLGFLWALDVGYAAALGLAVGFAPWVVRGLKRGRRERWLRIGTLCGAVVLGAATLEAASAVILARQGRTSAMPAGESLVERHVRQEFERLHDVELPTEFPDEPGRVSVTVVGESSAAGVPFDRWLSIGRVVARELGRAIPGRDFQADVMANSGDTLERQHRNLVNLRHRPDVLIVYCGHNEFAARIPLSRDRRYYDDDGEPTALQRLASGVYGWSWLHALVRRNMEKCRIAIPPPANGHRALVDTPGYSDVERDRILDDFRRRLEEIAAYAEKLGAILVLITPPGNDSGYDPNRSYLPPETLRDGRARFEADFLAAKALEATDPDAAVAAYRKLAEEAPRFAATQWRLARLLADRGDTAEAYARARIARDVDGYPQRAPTDVQEAYREVARRHDCIYIDGQEYFHNVSPDGLLDDRLFHDAMHPSFRGHLALAQAVLRGLRARRAFGWPADAPEPAVDPAEAAEHFFKSDPAVWRYVCLWGMMSFEITGPASFDPSLRRGRYEAFARAADAIEAGAPPDSVEPRGVGRLDPVPLVPYGDRDASP